MLTNKINTLLWLITSAKEVMYGPRLSVGLFVCLFVCNFT